MRAPGGNIRTVAVHPNASFSLSGLVSRHVSIGSTTEALWGLGSILGALWNCPIYRNEHIGSEVYRRTMSGINEVQSCWRFTKVNDSTVGFPQADIWSLRYSQRLSCVLIGSDHRAPLQCGGGGIGEDNRDSYNAKIKAPPLNARGLAIAGLVLIYKGLQNIHFGRQDWRGVALTLIGGVLRSCGLAIFLCWLVV